jgi:hypothetical protein
MRITRRPLYFSPQPMRFAPRGRWRLLALAALGGALAVGGAAIGTGIAREAPPEAVVAVQPLEVSARHGLAITPWEEAPVEEAPVAPAALVEAAPAPSPVSQAGPVAMGTEQLRVAGTEIGLVLRAGPSTASLRVALISDGALLSSRGVPVFHERRTWRPVRTRDGDAGWVADAYLQPAVP